MIGEKHGPVVDAVEGDAAAHGHALVRVALGQGQGRRQRGAQVGAVDVDIATRRVRRGQVVNDPTVRVQGIVNRERPIMECRRRRRRLGILGLGHFHPCWFNLLKGMETIPPIIDNSRGMSTQEGRHLWCNLC